MRPTRGGDRDDVGGFVVEKCARVRMPGAVMLLGEGPPLGLGATGSGNENRVVEVTNGAGVEARNRPRPKDSESISVCHERLRARVWGKTRRRASSGAAPPMAGELWIVAPLIETAEA